MILIKISIAVMTITEKTRQRPSTRRPSRTFRAPALAALAASAALALAACGGTAAPQSAGTPATGAHGEHSTGGTEAEAAVPRLVLTHDGGLTVLDAATGEVAAELPMEGFNRVNPAGDGRHVLVSTAGGFQVLDVGSWSEQHGDHFHHFTAAPALTDLAFPAAKPGHVVPHAGRTALFDDGTGKVQVFSPAELGAKALPATQDFTAAAAHHGVAVQLAEDKLIVTNGTSESRDGASLLDKPAGDGTRAVLASSNQCPGVHGEAAAQGGAVVLGCQDGILLVKNGTMTKLSSPDNYGRIGNQAGSEASPVVLGDYKTDKDAELERPRQFSLTDTATGKLRIVPIDYSYSFRSLARGPKGEALILGTDGKLHIHDAGSGAESAAIAVTAAWEEPLDWQQPRPAVFVDGATAYVSDPATKKLHIVDLASAAVTASHALPHTPNELTGTTG